MRTTLSIDDDIMAAARGLAMREGKSIGEVISGLARQGLRLTVSANLAATCSGVPLLPVRADSTLVTPELVALLRDEMP